MTVRALIADLRARGVTLVPDGDRLRCRPRAALTQDDLTALRAHKAAVLERLRTEPAAVSSNLICYACGGHRFWGSIHGAVTCARCHPPAGPDLVAEWIGGDADEAAGDG